MRSYPLLNLNNVTLDPVLVGRVPHALASYYMALPLAREDDRVSVVMTHPENDTAVAILSRLLGGTVVPVRGTTDAIRSALATLKPSETELPDRVIGWNEQPECCAAVDAWMQVLSDRLGGSATMMSPSDCHDGSLLSAIATERYRLVVADSPISSLLGGTLQALAGPLLYVRSPEVRPLRRLLVVLRGYSSDELALEWASALVQSPETSLTIMSLRGEGRALHTGLREALSDGTRCCGQLSHRRQPMEKADPQMYLKVRSGSSVQQLCDEAEDGAYDLIVICAEGEGAFIGRSLAALDQRNLSFRCPVLIVKPNY